MHVADLRGAVGCIAGQRQCESQAEEGESFFHRNSNLNVVVRPPIRALIKAVVKCGLSAGPRVSSRAETFERGPPPEFRRSFIRRAYLRVGTRAVRDHRGLMIPK